MFVSMAAPCPLSRKLGYRSGVHKCHIPVPEDRKPLEERSQGGLGLRHTTSCAAPRLCEIPGTLLLLLILRQGPAQKGHADLTTQKGCEHTLHLVLDATATVRQWHIKSISARGDERYRRTSAEIERWTRVSIGRNSFILYEGVAS